MLNSRLTLLLLAGVLLYGCTSAPAPVDIFKVPQLPVLGQLGALYRPVSAIDTPFNLDNIKEKIIVQTDFMSADSIRRYGLDTMTFYQPQQFIEAKEGYGWQFGGLGLRSTNNWNEARTETIVRTQIESKVVVTPYVVRASGQLSIPAGVFDVGLNALVLASARLNNSVCYAIGYPIAIQLKEPDGYYKINHSDSFPMKSYSDKVDSTQLVYLRVTVRPVPDSL